MKRITFNQLLVRWFFSFSWDSLYNIYRYFLAAIAHHIPFVYVEQAINDQDITNAFNRFLEDFNPKKVIKIPESNDENPLQTHLNQGLPVLTPFEQHLLLEHLIHSTSTKKLRQLVQIEKCVIQYIQMISETNYPSLKPLSSLDPNWFKTFLHWAYPQMKSVDLSWLNLEQLWFLRLILLRKLMKENR